MIKAVKYFAIMAVLVFAGNAIPSIAQDIFNTPHDNVQAIEPAAGGDVFNKPNASNAPATQAPAPAATQTGAVTENKETAFAKAYYLNCKKQNQNALKPDTQELLCSCSAANLQAGKMSIAEIKQMRENTPVGQEMRNKMLVEIYAPCIEFPTHDLIKGSCLSDPKIKVATKNPAALCGCMADKVSRHLADNAQEIIRSELEKNPNNLDPLGIFLNSATYEQQSRQALMACVMNK